MAATSSAPGNGTQGGTIDPAEFAALDALQLAVLVLDHSFRPVFLSGRAAQLLGIVGRSTLDPHRNILAPLITLAERSPKGTPKHLPNSVRALDELTLSTTDHRTVHSLAYVTSTQRQALPVYFVTFHDLSNLQPFFMTIEKTRRARSLLVLSACSLGRPFVLADLVGKFAADSVLKPFPELETSSPLTRENTTDLLPALTTVIDIVDQLIPSSTNLTLEAKTSALVQANDIQFRRLLCHLLLETADFVGPLGTIRVRSIVGPKDSRTLSSAHEDDRFIELVVFGNRPKDLNNDRDIVEFYLSRKCFGSQYRVTVLEDEPTIRQLANGEETVRHLKTSTGDKVDVADNASVAPETFSEDLTLASAIAKQFGFELQVRRPEEGSLVIYLQCRLGGF